MEMGNCKWCACVHLFSHLKSDFFYISKEKNGTNGKKRNKRQINKTIKKNELQYVLLDTLN